MSGAAYAIMTDTITELEIEFIMQADWEPAIIEVGSILYELGNNFGILLTDGTKGVGGTLTIVSTTDDMAADVITMLSSSNVKELIMPNGDTYYIVFDPGTARKGSQQFALMSSTTPISVWTVDYIQVATP
jgi:hypothetical protein